MQTRGEFGGLGIEVTMEDGLIKVVSPIDETPASKAGIMANDIISNLDDEPVQGLTLNQAVEKMRGPVNTKIRLKIIRKGQDKPIEVTLCATTSASVRCARASRSDDIAYIRVTTLQRADHRRPETRDGEPDHADRSGQDQGLHPRPAQQSGRTARGSRVGVRCVLDRGEIVSTRGRNAEETQRRTAKPAISPKASR